MWAVQHKDTHAESAQQLLDPIDIVGFAGDSSPLPEKCLGALEVQRKRPVEPRGVLRVRLDGGGRRRVVSLRDPRAEVGGAYRGTCCGRCRSNSRAGVPKSATAARVNGGRLQRRAERGRLGLQRARDARAKRVGNGLAPERRPRTAADESHLEEGRCEGGRCEGGRCEGGGCEGGGCEGGWSGDEEPGRRGIIMRASSMRSGSPCRCITPMAAWYTEGGAGSARTADVVHRGGGG